MTEEIYEGTGKVTVTHQDDGSTTCTTELVTKAETVVLPPVNGIGLFCLHPAYKQEGKYTDPATESGNTNPNMQGILWRQHWYLLEKSQNNFDWTYYDAAFLASQTHNKLATVEILGGQTTPSWFYALPKAAKLVCSTGGYETPVPWDPVHRNSIHNLMIAFRDRYYEANKDRWSYVKIWQVGKASESNLVQYIEDMPAAHTLAQSSAYSWTAYADAHEAWRDGVQELIDMTADVFYGKVPFLLVTLPPFPDQPASSDDLAAMFDYGNTKYPWWFGTRSDSLYENKPKPGDFPYEIVKSSALISSTAGYQFGNKMTPNDPAPPAKLAAALDIGLEVGAHFMELFPADYEAESSIPVLIDAWNRIQAQGTGTRKKGKLQNSGET